MSKTLASEQHKGACAINAMCDQLEPPARPELVDMKAAFRSSHDGPAAILELDRTAEAKPLTPGTSA